MRYGLLAACFVVAAVPNALAGEDCTCRAAGIEVVEGETICLKTANGPQLARCERVLNNTSWTFLDGPCPSAGLSPVGETSEVAASAPAAGAAFVR